LLIIIQIQKLNSEIDNNTQPIINDNKLKELQMAVEKPKHQKNNIKVEKIYEEKNQKQNKSIETQNKNNEEQKVQTDQTNNILQKQQIDISEQTAVLGNIATEMKEQNRLTREANTLRQSTHMTLANSMA